MKNISQMGSCPRVGMNIEKSLKLPSRKELQGISTLHLHVNSKVPFHHFPLRCALLAMNATPHVHMQGIHCRFCCDREQPAHPGTLVVKQPRLDVDRTQHKVNHPSISCLVQTLIHVIYPTHLASFLVGFPCKNLVSYVCFGVYCGTHCAKRS